MKKVAIVSLGIFFSLVLFSGIACAADKLAYIDLSRTFNEYKKTKVYDKTLNDKEKIALVSHTDLDGIAAAVITNKVIEADIVILAMGFIYPEKKPLIENLKLDSRGNILTDENYMTNIRNVYAAGDAHIGAKLVVSAIYEGRCAAEAINSFFI